MEVRFDSKGNILNARLLATHDDSPMYLTKTNFAFTGRDITLLQDMNPAAGSGNVTTVGAIHWRDKIITVQGHRRKIADLKAKKGKFLSKVFCRERHWRWAEGRREYAVQYNTNDEWVAMTTDSSEKSELAARFKVPYRPHLLTKSDPPLLTLTKTALLEDEIFLLLVLIYSEAKRQDDTNSSVGHGSEGW